MISRRDKILARAAHMKNLVSKEELDQCLALMRERQGAINLPQSMVELGYLSPMQMDRLMYLVEVAIQKAESPSSQQTPPPLPGQKPSQQTPPPLPGQKPSQQTPPPLPGQKPSQQTPPPLPGQKPPQQTPPPLPGQKPPQQTPPPLPGQKSPQQTPPSLPGQKPPQNTPPPVIDLEADAPPGFQARNMESTHLHWQIIEDQSTSLANTSAHAIIEDEEDDIVLLDDVTNPHSQAPEGTLQLAIPDELEEWAEIPPHSTLRMAAIELDELDEEEEESPVKKIIPSKDFAERVKKFAGQVLAACLAPLKPRGFWALSSWFLAGAFAMGLAWVISLSEMLALPLYALAFTWFYASVSASLFALIQAGVDGDKRLPPFDPYYDIWIPPLLMLASLAICLLPSFAYIHLYQTPQVSASLEQYVSLGYIAALLKVHFYSLDPLHMALRIVGYFFLPMALIAMSIFRDPLALNPLFICRSIWGVFLRYLAILTVFTALLIGYPYLVDYVLQLDFNRYNFASLFGVGVAALALHAYLIVVGAYLLGLIGQGNKDRMGW